MSSIWFSVIIVTLVIFTFWLVWVYATIFQAQKNILDIQKKLIYLAKERSHVILKFIEALKLQKEINPELCDKILTIGNKINDNTQDEAAILVLENKLSKAFQDVITVLKENPKWKASDLIQNTEKDLKPLQEKNQAIQEDYKVTISHYNGLLKTAPTKYIVRLFGYKTL